MVDKLIITKHSIQTATFTEEELAQRETDRLAQEEQALLDSLTPSAEEVAQAEFEIRTITLLTEVGSL